MNPMTKEPFNMTRVIVEDHDGIFSFAYYKDGLFEIDGLAPTPSYYRPDEFAGWLSISELKQATKKKCMEDILFDFRRTFGETEDTERVKKVEVDFKDMTAVVVKVNGDYFSTYNVID